MGRSNSPSDAALKRLPLILLLLAVLTLALDQFTKWLIVSHLEPGQAIAPIPALSAIFDITYTTNTGVSFGLFKEAGTLLVGVAIVVIVAIMGISRKLPPDQRLRQVALGLALGGAFGNLVDRLRIGHVIDFIHFHFWPVFNVADSALFIGVLLLALSTWRETRQSSIDAGKA